MLDGDGSTKRFFNRAQIYIIFGAGFMLGIFSIIMLYNHEFSSVTSIRVDKLTSNLGYTETNLVSIRNRTKEIIFDTNLIDKKTKEKNKQHALLRLFNCTEGGNTTASFAKCNPSKRRRSKGAKTDIDEKLASITTSIVNKMRNQSSTTNTTVGGCSGTRYGCCLHTKVPKKDAKGSNCR